MPATIDIPGPSPWTILDGGANTQGYCWGQPQYNALISGRGFNADFNTILEKSQSTLGYIIFGCCLFGTGTGATGRLSADKI